MDGVDIALCRFAVNNNQWDWEILAADCVDYPEVWQTRLIHLPDQNAETFAKTDIYYGHFLGKLVREFLSKNSPHPPVDLVSSHGQTVFHNPVKGYTVQIGSGAGIAAECGLPVVCDLRSMDMAYGGQGAPIVPMGEKHLFPQYSAFLNLGGIANIQLHADHQVLGWDVGGANILLDTLVGERNLAYDEDGRLARAGIIDQALLQQLNSHDYFQQKLPKSLDAQWVINQFLPRIDTSKLSLEDKLATVVEHHAQIIGKALNEHNVKEIYVTGGGALNGFFMERIQANNSAKIVIPEADIVTFKEAIIMAFLGLLRWQSQPNVLSSVTGASKNSINGAIYLP